MQIKLAAMFIGHFAPALIAAAHVDRPRLGLLFAGAQLVDIIFAGLVLSGVEAMRVVPGITAMNPMDLYHMPWSHSLAGNAGFALLFGGAVWLMTRDQRAAWAAGAVVLSHWFIDWLVHRPDLTLFGVPPKLGLGLWDVPIVAMPLELALAGGALAWLMLRRPRWRRRLAVLGGVLLLVQLYNWFAPPPTRMGADVPITMLAAYALLAAVAAWAVRWPANRLTNGSLP